MRISICFSAFLIFLSVFTPAQSTKGKKDNVQVISIKTNGKCEMCKTRIESATRSVKGVKATVFDLEENSVNVTFRNDKTNGDAIRQAISKAGYDADDIKADSEAKDKLPDCCRSRSSNRAANRDKRSAWSRSRPFSGRRPCLCSSR